MKTTKITNLQFSFFENSHTSLNQFSKKTILILASLIVFGINAYSETVVTYAQQIANYYSTFISGATIANQGSYQVGMTAKTSAPKQAVAWRKFRTDASGTNSSDRSLQIGDQFVVTLSCTRAYGQIGFALLASPSTGSFANRESNYAVSVYLPGPLYPAGASWAGKWSVKSSGGTITTASFGGNQSPTWKNFTFTMTLIAANRMNITMTDGTNTSYFFDVQLNTSNPITDYCIYQEDDWDGGGNMGCYWGLGAVGTQHTLTDKGTISMGSSNSSFAVSGVLKNGYAANSSSTVVNNSFTKVGTGNITLAAANTYSGITQLDGGILTLGATNAIPSGVSGVQSAVTFNGGALSTGASSAGCSCGTSAYPMGALTLNATGGTISMAASSSGQNLYFANSSGASWGAGTLTINGWTGTPGTTGTNGHIYVGNSSGGLSAAQLSKIIFTGYSGHAMLLSTGELVPLISPMYFCSGNFVSPNNWAEASSAAMTAIAGKSPTNSTTYYISTNSNNTGSDFFKFFSNLSGSGAYYGPSSNTSENLSTAFTMSTTNRAGGFSYYIAGTSGNNYVFKTIGTTTSNASAVVFNLGASGVVRTVSSVAQSPVSNSVYAGYPTTVTATISGAFTGSQIPYLRYSTSATFATSTVVAMTGSGTTYSATIPGGTNVAATPVYYYIFTSGSGGTNPASDGSDADLFAINYNDNAGSNYSYTPIAGSPDITFSVGTPGSGSSGYVGNTVTITGTNLSGVNSLKIGGASGTAVTSFTVVNPTTITFNAIEATGTLWLTDGTSTASSAATYTNLGYISTADGDWNTASSWLGNAVPTAGSAVTIANDVTLNAAATNNPVSVTINSGKSLSLGASGALTINAGGSLTNNGNAILGNAGIVTFAGTATLTGATTFNNLTLNGTTSFVNAPTINGTLKMNSGTSILTNSPVYGSTATLNYNLNNGFAAKYNTSLEWPASSGPSSVTLSTNSWVQLTGNRAISGNLTVSGGALQATGALRTLTMNGTSQFIDIAGGAIYGTDNGLNNDLQLTVASGSTTLLTGNATASADDEKKFYNINVASGGKLALSRGILCKHGAFTVAGTLQINPNGYVQSNNTTNSALASTNAAANYAAGGTLIYNNAGSYNCTDKEWPTSNSPTNVSLTAVGTNVSLNNAKSVSGTLTLTNGVITLGGNDLTIGTGGSISGASSASFIVTDGTGKLIQNVAGSGSKLFPIGISSSSYDPATVYPNATVDFSAKVGSVLSGTLNNSGLTNPREWTITPLSGTPTATLTLAPSVATNVSSPVIGQYSGGSWTETDATVNSGAFGGDFSNFNNFATGSKYGFTGISALAVSSSTGVSSITNSSYKNIDVSNNSLLSVDVPNATLNQLTIEPGSRLTTTNSLNITGDLILKADLGNSFSANIISTLNVGGSIKYYKTIDDTKWYFLSFPSDVTIAQISATNTSLGTLGTDWFIKYYDGAQRGTNGTTSTNWKSITNADLIAEPTKKLNKYQGYIFGLPFGKLQTELAFILDKTVISSELSARNITVAANQGPSTNTNHGWNLIGQPYLSRYLTKNATGADNYFIYVSDGISTYSAYQSTSAPDLDPMSAYFVQASSTLASGNGGVGIVFALDGRKSAPSVVRTNLSDNIQLSLTTPTGTDRTNLIMNETQSTDYQIGQDLEKWLGTGTDKPQIYSVMNGTNLAFNALPLGSVTNLPLAFYTKTGGRCVIHLDVESKNELSQFKLTDKISGVETDLMQTDYAFTADAGTTDKRFVINAYKIISDTKTINNNAPEMLVENGKLTIAKINADVKVRIFDMMGRLIIEQKTITDRLELTNLVKGVYNLQIEIGNQLTSQKLIVK